MWIITVFEQNTYRMFEYKTKNEASAIRKNKPSQQPEMACFFLVTVNLS